MIVGIALAVLTFRPAGVPSPLRFFALDPYIVIVNIMACRVYRRTKLGLIRESEISTTTINKKYAMHAVVLKNVTVSGGEATMQKNCFKASTTTIPTAEKNDLV